ncbi:SusC/RagA family TonB-linked outer membrane protein [Flagellimonas pacifica]|uniref:TonB-linked outer membrane protein, SusC/RagA family n=1 Tax=Flagellimonas pacifica TaxID=1247520 RepID=A0A285MY74_9FLAO|nr:SusC/RagA family TonB-linked outer membrane protein [Allomuricauda parva]SNZ01497.1 TonB-linked outer membrane protein, SusC/RagA family [Allomuricauda parva]
MKVKKLFGTLVFVLLSIASVQSQEKTITGTILDQTGTPLPGVNIIVQGTANGTQSDFDGNYAITASIGQTLVFTYLGQRTTQREVGAQNVINVQMEEDAQALEEVVVTGSASGKSLKELSFALGQVKNELLENVPATSAAAALQGKVSGVSISSPGGQPGSNVSIQLRTANSLSTGQDPLVIVDGVILEGGLADINTEDIDRIEIAKGAAGASLYGSRAANGVIQIFTKRGKGNNKINVTYRSELGVKEITSKYDLATTHRFKLTADGSAFDLTSGSREVDDDGLSDNRYPIGNIFNYQDEIFTTGVFNTHYASISGGDEKTRYLFSYQRLQDEGIYVLVDDYRRDNFRLNLDNNLSDKISVKTSLFYSNSNRDAAINSGTTVGILFPALITEPIYDWNAVNEEDGSPYNFDSNTFDPNIKNPLYTLANNDKSEKRNRVLGNVALDYRVTPWLKLNGSYSYDFENNTFQDYIPKGYLSDDPDGQAQNIGFIQRSNFNGRAQNTRFNALFSPFSVDSDYNLALRFSYLHERYESEFNNSEGYNLAVSGIRSLDNITDSPSVSSQAQEILTDSYFVIADFDYKDKYIFSGVARREGSSLFGPNTRWANYFRTSLAYRVTEDIQIPGVQELKLRASYGTAGIRPSYEMRFETFLLRNGSPTRATIGNNDLRPAKTGELELGLNMNFLDRFSFEFNYVKAKTEDQILRVPLSAAAGFSAQWRNAGEIDATTYEASLNANIIKSDNVSWDLGIVWDKSEQKVSQLDVPAYLTGPGTQETTLFRIEEGQNFGVMYGNDFITSLSDLPAGSNASDFVVNSAGFVVDQATGETPVRRADASGNEFFVIGDITPDFRMGINTTFNYKNVSLYALFDWKQGGDIYNKTKQWLYRDGRHTDITSGLPYNFYQGLYNVNLPSSAFVEDGSFVKLRELSLYYTLKGESLGSVANFIDTMKFGFVGRNLLTFTNYSGFDPEITHQSESNRANLTTRDTDGIGNDPNTPGGDPNIFKVDNFPYPTTKTYSFSVQLTF